MALIAEPIFFNSLRKRVGAKRKVIYIRNTEAADVEVTVTDVQKPEWVELEGVIPGTQMAFPGNERTAVVANVNTSHVFFPEEPVRNERIKVSFDNDLVLEISISIPEIISKIEDFRGVFAVDFGTSNSCYAYKMSAIDAGRKRGAETTRVSKIHPSIIFFHDVADHDNPSYTIGNEARQDITENSWQTYAFVYSIKRHMGRDKTMVLLDRLAGAHAEHQQEWHVEEIASFLVRELIDRAENELGKRIVQCVATFPPLFSQDRKAAIRRIFANAFKARGTELDEEDLIMELDEASSAAFFYVYNTMVEEFRRFARDETKANLLTYDMGGGTIDISLVHVEIKNVGGKLHITTELRGLSGEPTWAGDNVTLATFKIVKYAAALAAAKDRVAKLAEAEKATVQQEEAKKKEDDIWAVAAAKEKTKKDPFADFFSAMAVEEEKEEEAVKEEPEIEDPELRQIKNEEEPAAYEAALRTVAAAEKIIEECLKTGKPLREVATLRYKEQDPGAHRDDLQRQAEELDRAIETVVPTRFAVYQDENPFKAELARQVFHELWNEAELLKVRLSSAEDGVARIANPLKKAAKYSGVDQLLFNDLRFSIKDLNQWIAPIVTKTLTKARTLYENVNLLVDEPREEADQAQPAGGLQVGGLQGLAVGGGLAIGGQKPRTGEGVEQKILLFGNSSNLPIVREKVFEVFPELNPQNVVFNAEWCKAAVARGAAEEYELRKVLGDTGPIRLEAKGFLDKIPYALGLYHADLALAGAKGGYYPIFERGTPVGAKKILTQESAFLIYPKMRDLAIYVDYKDGDEPAYVGYFDFLHEDGKVAPPGSEVFGIELELLPTRELMATNLQTGSQYKMKVVPFSYEPEENPFSGIH